MTGATIFFGKSCHIIFFRFLSKKFFTFHNSFFFFVIRIIFLLASLLRVYSCCRVAPRIYDVRCMMCSAGLTTTGNETITGILVLYKPSWFFQLSVVELLVWFSHLLHVFSYKATRCCTFWWWIKILQEYERTMIER